MCDGIALRLPDGGEVCIPIYVDIPNLKVKPGPDPDPWRDLHVLVTINELVSNLGIESMRSQMSGMLRETAQQVVRELPEGFELGSDFLAMADRTAAD